MRKSIAPSLSVSFIICLSGCIGAIFEGAHITKDGLKREQNREAAERGDKIAQYNMGEAYCCSTDDSGLAYDTSKAVEWLCKSAKKGYGPAMYKLGKIYSGDLIDGIRVLRRAATGLTEAVEGADTVNLPVSYAWLRLAVTYGEKDARDPMEEIKNKMNMSEKEKAGGLALKGLNIPCEIKQVFPK